MPGRKSWLGIDRVALINAMRATVTAVVSMVLARGWKMPEFFWAPISSIVILLSTVDPLTLAWQRFAGTAVGAIIGALISSYFEPNWIAYGVGIFVCGLLCAVLRVGPAYRFGAISVSIVLLIAHSQPPWIVALDRFIEVSVGIAVALVVTLVWPAPK